MNELSVCRAVFFFPNPRLQRVDIASIPQFDQSSDVPLGIPGLFFSS